MFESKTHPKSGHQNKHSETKGKIMRWINEWVCLSHIRTMICILSHAVTRRWWSNQDEDLFIFLFRRKRMFVSRQQQNHEAAVFDSQTNERTKCSPLLLLLLLLMTCLSHRQCCTLSPDHVTCCLVVVVVHCVTHCLSLSLSSLFHSYRKDQTTDIFLIIIIMLSSTSSGSSSSGQSGQSFSDRMNAARYAIAGQGLNRVVCKATTEEMLGPKKKHLDCELTWHDEHTIRWYCVVWQICCSVRMSLTCRSRVWRICWLIEVPVHTIGSSSSSPSLRFIISCVTAMRDSLSIWQLLPHLRPFFRLLSHTISRIKSPPFPSKCLPLFVDMPSSWTRKHPPIEVWDVIRQRSSPHPLLVDHPEDRVSVTWQLILSSKLFPFFR